MAKDLEKESIFQILSYLDNTDTKKPQKEYRVNESNFLLFQLDLYNKPELMLSHDESFKGAILSRCFLNFNLLSPLV